MNFSSDVVVIGGGVVGLSAALAMAKNDLNVVLIDAGPLQVDIKAPDPRVYAINKASIDFLTQISAWEHVPNERKSPYQKMYVWDSQSNSNINFDCRTKGTDNLGFIMEESILRFALLTAIKKQKNITLEPNTIVKNIVDEKNRVQIFGNNNIWEAKHFIIADGKHSPSKKILNITSKEWSYHQHALVATIKTEKVHNDTAWQVFTPEGTLAFLPLTDPNLCSIVWSTRPGHAKHLQELDEETFNQTLEHTFESKLGRTQVISNRFCFPLVMKQAERYSSQNWILVGDAAHSIHPMAGLGLNAGLADVALWYKLTQSNNDNLWGLTMMNQYNRERRTETWKLIVLLESLKMLFTNPLTPVKWLRGIGLNMINQFDIVKRLIIQQAQGI